MVEVRGTKRASPTAEGGGQASRRSGGDNRTRNSGARAKAPRANVSSVNAPRPIAQTGASAAVAPASPEAVSAVLPLKRKLDGLANEMKELHTLVAGVQTTMNDIRSKLETGAFASSSNHSDGRSADTQSREEEKASKSHSKTIKDLGLCKQGILLPLIGRSFFKLSQKGSYPTSLLVALGCPVRAPLKNLPPSHGPHGGTSKELEVESPADLVLDAVLRHAAYGLLRKLRGQIEKSGLDRDSSYKAILSACKEWRPTRKLCPVAQAAIHLLRKAMNAAREKLRDTLRVRLGAALAVTAAGGSEDLELHLAYPDFRRPSGITTMDVAKIATLKDFERYQFTTAIRYSQLDKPDAEKITVELSHNIIEIADKVLGQYGPKNSTSKSAYLPGVASFGSQLEKDALNALLLFAESLLDAVRRMQGMNSQGDFRQLDSYQTDLLLGVSHEAKKQTASFIEGHVNVTSAKLVQITRGHVDVEDPDGAGSDGYDFDADFADIDDEDG